MREQMSLFDLTPAPATRTLPHNGTASSRVGAKRASSRAATQYRDMMDFARMRGAYGFTAEELCVHLTDLYDRHHHPIVPGDVTGNINRAKSAKVGDLVVAGFKRTSPTSGVAVTVYQHGTRERR